MRLGVHIAPTCSLMDQLRLAEKLGLGAIQIATRSSERWFTSPIPPEQVLDFRRGAARFPPGHVLSHASHLINIASIDEATYTRSMDALFDELMRAEALGISWVVLHPGNHGGKGEQRGIRRAIHSLNRIFERAKGFRVGILLETMPRKESELGSSFADLARIRQRVSAREKVGICVDVSHIFAAGYDIRELQGYKATMDDLDRQVGLRHVKAFHLSDSKLPLASQCCTHTHVGQGEIGLDAFAFIVNDQRFRDVPLILETPRGNDLKAHEGNLARLEQLVGTVTV